MARLHRTLWHQDVMARFGFGRLYEPDGPWVQACERHLYADTAPGSDRDQFEEWLLARLRDGADYHYARAAWERGDESVQG